MTDSQRQARAAEVREFLSTRRARITPQQAGLPFFGGNRRVPGLRRQEVATLAGMSIDYYIRLERGNLSGASDSVLDSLSHALQLHDAERAYLYDLASAVTPADRRPPAATGRIRPVVLRMLDAMTDLPAYLCNGRFDLLAANSLGRALYAPVYDSPLFARRGPVNTARFLFLDPGSAGFWPRWEPADPGLRITVYSPEPGSPGRQSLDLLASWAGSAVLER